MGEPRVIVYEDTDAPEPGMRWLAIVEVVGMGFALAKAFGSTEAEAMQACGRIQQALIDRQEQFIAQRAKQPSPSPTVTPDNPGVQS